MLSGPRIKKQSYKRWILLNRLGIDLRVPSRLWAKADWNNENEDHQSEKVLKEILMAIYNNLKNETLTKINSKNPE